jgi:hypothetical protein
MRFGPNWLLMKLIPVTLPPGRFKLATNPCWTGSLPFANTIGMLAVAALAASAETTLPVAKIASTGRLTTSAASAGSLSYWKSAQR